MIRKIHFIAMVALFWAYALVPTVGCGPSNSENNNVNTNTNTNTGCYGDEDGDGICDRFEGKDTNLDTDGDGTPDYKDLDSDDDGIADSVEYGYAESGTPPTDSDGDGTPDFQDTDSDGNGLADGVDGTADLDADGKGNYADLDDDGDGIPDLVEMDNDPYAPPDTDQDGVPNYQDVDSDGDTILDLHEGGGGITDTDQDGLPDYLDLDSDNDGILDNVEAGDANPNTAPVDTDHDAIPDYRDPDSDNDGLPDGQEDLNGNGVVDPGESDPHNADTDGDGVTDLIEVAAGTDPQDNTDNPQANGDFYFVVAYEEATDPTQDTLEFRTSVQFADLYFNFDETGSMIEEFGVLSAPTGVPALIDDLTCADTGVPCTIDSDCNTGEVCFNHTGTCIQDPLDGDGCVADLWTGVGMWNNCNTYHNVVHLQNDPVTTANAISTSYPGASESPLQSAACVADPSFCSNTNIACSADSSITNPIGCPGFRPDAVRILIHITDADNQAGSSCGGVSTAAIAGNALSAQGIKFIGLYGTDDDGSGSPCTSPLQCAEQLGTTSGTVDSNNDPFVYPIGNDGTTLVAQTRQAVLELVRGVPLNTTIGAEDLPGDDGDALQFIDYLEVNVSGTGNCTNVSPTLDTDNPLDGHDDSFPELLGGTPVCWDVHPIPLNDFVPATAVPQVFVARLTVYGDGSPLDQRDVYFLVPPVVDATVIPQ